MSISGIELKLTELVSLGYCPAKIIDSRQSVTDFG